MPSLPFSARSTTPTRTYVVVAPSPSPTCRRRHEEGQVGQALERGGDFQAEVEAGDALAADPSCLTSAGRPGRRGKRRLISISCPEPVFLAATPARNSYLRHRGDWLRLLEDC